MLDFVCQCGRGFVINGQPGKYVCSTCKTPHYFKVDGEKYEREHAVRLNQNRVAKQTESRIIRIVKRFAIESDRGVGDTVERLLARVGGRVFKAKLEQLGIDCGCQSRQDWLNKKWPYTRLVTRS